MTNKVKDPYLRKNEVVEKGKRLQDLEDKINEKNVNIEKPLKYNILESDLCPKK